MIKINVNEQGVNVNSKRLIIFIIFQQGLISSFMYKKILDGTTFPVSIDLIGLKFRLTTTTEGFSSIRLIGSVARYGKRDPRQNKWWIMVHFFTKVSTFMIFCLGQIILIRSEKRPMTNAGGWSEGMLAQYGKDMMWILLMASGDKLIPMNTAYRLIFWWGSIDDFIFFNFSITHWW